MLESVISKLENAAKSANPVNSGDYFGDDGLLYCGKCHTPKQCKISLFGVSRVMDCACQCAEERQRKVATKKHLDYLQRMRNRGNIRPDATFDAAQMSKNLQICMRYAKKFEEMRRKNIGILFWGDVGTGKTFAAHCICNALLEREIPMPGYITSTANVLSGGFDKSGTLDIFRRMPLVVLDDLGAERGSDYAIETVFSLVDERYRAQKPLIATSNIPLEEIKNPMIRTKNNDLIPDIRRKRIYDRVLEMCVPVCFRGGSKRERIANEKRMALEELL